MWQIEDISGAVGVVATILLDASQFGKGLPEGFEGQKESGFSFFEPNGYITSRITDKPVLTAVTESQFKKWKEKNIIAKPAVFIYKA